MRYRGPRQAARPTRRAAVLGWAIGATAIVLFAVGGAAVAGGPFGQILTGSAQPGASASRTGLPPSPTRSTAPSPTPTPTPAAALPPLPVSPADTPCATAVTLSIWAHYDDDLIFANPALQGAFDAGECIRTLFLTASDAGRGINYSQNRELGILRAYNAMRGHEGFWSEKRVSLRSGAVLSQWSPDGDPDVTVAFLRLPDGNLNGDGFPSTGHGSLSKMLSGTITELATVTDAPALSAETLIASLAEAIGAYHATRLMTHIPSTAASWAEGDHPDHAATGTFARSAWQRAGFPVDRVLYAIGYPSEQLPANVSGDALSRKLVPYRAYAAQDPVVACTTDAACLAKPRFGAWLQRHYLISDAELFPGG